MLARRKAFGHATSLTQRYSPRALQTLAQIMTDMSTSTSARVAAAVAILKFGRDAMEIEDLAVRIDALERKLKGGASQGKGQFGMNDGEPRQLGGGTEGTNN
jgi:hypothetical protein